MPLLATSTQPQFTITKGANVGVKGMGGMAHWKYGGWAGRGAGRPRGTQSRAFFVRASPPSSHHRHGEELLELLAQLGVLGAGQLEYVVGFSVVRRGLALQGAHSGGGGGKGEGSGGVEGRAFV